MWPRLLLCSLLLSACASVPRPTVEHTGQPYSVRRYDGRIAGQVCGQDIQYQVERQGGQLALVGFLGDGLPSRLEVRDQEGVRRITGSLGTTTGTNAVDLRVSPQRLEGRVGWRRYDLTRQDDQMVGELRMAGTDLPTSATIHGAAAMWSLPPADQAAILTNLLTCFVAPIGSFGRSPLVVGFGGRPGAQPRGSASIPGGG